MLTGSALRRFFFKDLIKVQPFSLVYGRIIIGFLMLLFSPSVVSMCGVGGTIYLLKSFLTSFTILVTKQCGYEFKLWNTFLKQLGSGSRC